ncbi:MAG: LptF/LptG family permease, partial [Bacteroidales bacterium]|nr:LptF/LptG family permease [Bacteroidales bacterium]
RGGKQMDTTISLRVSDFAVKKNMIQTLSYKELNEYIAIQQERGDENMKNSLIEKHQRFSLPFSAFILTLIGVSLSSHKRRGGIGWNIAIGIALSFSYILFMKFSEMFVFTGAMPVGLAIWLPNIIFAFIAAFLYKIAPK